MNLKVCFEILFVTSSTASGDFLTRVDLKFVRSLFNLINDSEFEEIFFVVRCG